jgi:hypothetical protein
MTYWKRVRARTTHDMRSSYNVLTGEPEGKRSLERFRRGKILELIT